MVSPKQLLSTLESTLLGPSPPTAAQRVELLHAIRTSSSSFQSLLSYSTPKSSDRNQVQSKSVRLPDSSPITLDDQDVQIALKLSDDLHLNEVDCVRLLVSANQEWGLMGRGPLEILRLAAGLWYTERRDLITSLHLLLRAVVLDQGLEDEILVDIQKYLEHLINSGLRQRLISLIKELNREDSSGLGGPQCEPYILDSRGSLVERRAVVSRERLIIGHCLVLSVLVVRTSPKDVKDIFSVLKDCASEVSVSNTTVKHQITFSLLFALVVAFVSDGLSTVPDKASILSSDASFRREFHELVMATGNDPVVEGFIGGIRLAWVVHLMLIQDGVAVRETVLSGSSNEMGYLSQCLDVIFSTNSFQFLLDKILHTASYQNEDEDMIYMYNAYLHKLITCFLSNSFARDKIKESKERTMSVLSPYRVVGSHDFAQDRNSSSQHGSDMGALTFNSILDFVSEIYQKEPELLSGNDVLWTFVNFAGEDHTTFQTLVTFLNMLSTLASSQEGASKVYELLQGKAFRSIGWSTLFECLTIYDDKFKQSLQTAGAMLPDIQEGDAKALVAYLNVLKKVVENGNPIERKNWFPDIEPLFKLLSYENVPPYLKGALRNAIATFIHVSPVLKDSIWTYLEQYDLPVVVGTDVQNSQQPMGTQVYDMQFELNEIEARREQYPSTISFLNLINALIAEERDLSDRGRRFIGIFRFIYDHVFGPFPQRAYADPCEKWQLVGACLQHFRMILTMYDVKDEDFEGIVDQSRLSTMKESSPLQTQLPVLELLKDFMSGKTAFRNIMGILLPGVNSIIAERSSQIYGQLLENAVQLSLEIIILVLEKDLLLSDYWRPLYQVEDILGNPGNSGKGGVYYYSERNDRLIDLASFHDKLWQKYTSTYLQVSNLGSEVELNDVRETIQQLLRWGWKYNKNLEEQAAQLHMVTAWSQIVEVSASRRLALLEDRSEILFQVLDASLSACASPDCSLKMAFILSQVALTCMAKLRDERFLFPGSLSSDNITCLDLIVVKQLSNGACLTILFKLIMAILRNESSEALRRRQYALLLSYFQYCQNVVDPDVPTTVLQFLLLSEQDNDYIDLPKIDKEQAELARANFSTLRKEAQSILDLVIKDATHGSEPGKTISLYVLDALICIDHERYFLNQLQSRGFLRSCFTAISSVSNQDGGLSLDSLQRACTFEAELALLLRISHKYEKSGAQVLFSMGILEHLSSGRIISSQGGLRRVETRLRRDMATDIDRQRMIVTPILRLVFSLTSLVDTSEFLEMKNKIVREIIDFVKGHQPLLDHILRVDIAEADDLRMEQINLVVGILSKIWPYEQSSEYGFVQGLFGMMHALFSRDLKVSSFAQSISPKNQRNSELQMFKLCFSLSSYLYFLVTKKSLRLQYSDATSSYPTSVEIQQPTLSLLNSLLTSVTTALERASEEKSLLLNKIRDINELSRQEVDEIINMCVQQDYVPSSDNIHKRRYIAMVEMCQVVASWDQQIILLLPLSEHVLNIILIHLQESCVASDSTLTTKTITYGAKYNPEQDIAFLCGKLVPALERLELLSEDKIGRNLKVFNRLVTSAKDVAIQKLVL
ncbi:PREDICTED: nuclear pore complex protein NUP205-like isoform X6 [Lupinus angustifolius]|uniref:nuclear pore complex protein NUP205-like isoform X6 n=1 Tax=Lupinus angustifolius TaxID=3871 RepID=UPI00092E7F9E|nr:PREDICTED: nuclear pore complex protein NUP205-like isoform X6 [Lupinus angustifolius]